MKLHHSIVFSVTLGFWILALGVCSADTISPDMLVKIADTLRAELRTRDQWTYRTTLFVLFKETHTLTNSDLVARIRVLAHDIHSKGADGVDALLVHYVDAAAQRKMDAATVAETRKELHALHGRVRYVDDHPANIKIPFGRSSTRMVLDVRAEAMQILLEQTVGFPGTGIPTIEELLNGKPTTDALCALPVQKDQNGNIPPVEQEREENCTSSGKPGGSGGAGGALGGGIAESGCMNAHVQELQQMIQQVRDMEECMEDAFQGTKVPAFGWVPVGAAIIAGIAAIDAAQSLVQTYYVEPKLEAVDRYGEAVKRYGEAVDRAVAADKAADEAERDLAAAESAERNAESELKEAQDAERNAQTDAQRQAVEAKRKEAEKAERDAETARKEAEAKAKEKRKEAEDAQKKAEDEGKKAEATRPQDSFTGEEGRTSEACKRAMGGRDLADPNRPLRGGMDKLNENWKELKSRWDRVSYPTPDSDNPFITLDHPFCGLDSATTEGASSSCQVPVLCTEEYQPNTSCGCSKSTGGHKPLQQLQCMAMRCANDTVPTAVGPVCSCGSTGTNPPDVVFTPPKPRPVVIDVFFATPAQESIDPARVMVNRMMR
jgi:hypothetical protein